MEGPARRQMPNRRCRPGAANYFVRRAFPPSAFFAGHAALSASFLLAFAALPPPQAKPDRLGRRPSTSSPQADAAHPPPKPAASSSSAAPRSRAGRPLRRRLPRPGQCHQPRLRRLRARRQRLLRGPYRPPLSPAPRRRSTRLGKRPRRRCKPAGAAWLRRLRERSAPSVHAALPETRLLFLAIKESPCCAFRVRGRRARQANALVAADCAARPAPPLSSMSPRRCSTPTASRGPELFFVPISCICCPPAMPFG